MKTVSDVLTILESIAPTSYAFAFDKVGLQVGDPLSELTGALCALDCGEDAVEAAIGTGCNLIVAHHPLVWNPLSAVRTDQSVGNLVAKLLRNRVSMIAVHTNWDCAQGGINDTLAGVLGLADVRPFGSRSDAKTYKVVTFAPSSVATRLIDAMSDAGAGRIGLYSRCAFMSDGTGTFRGGDGSSPTVGSAGQTVETPETRIEMVVEESSLGRVLDALRSAHPYEEPAFDVVPLHNSVAMSLSRIGSLQQPVSWPGLLELVDDRLQTRCTGWPGRANEIRTVAVVGGAGDKEWRDAQRAGADAIVTGEVRHDVAIEATASGMAIVQAGHYATEQPGMEALALRLVACGIPATGFRPPAGVGGRPT